MKLMPHQVEVLDKTKNHNRVAYYIDMGLGKTYIGSEKLKQLDTKYNLLVCQKSKINDWLQHFKTNYDYNVEIYKNQLIEELPPNTILIINYDLIWRRQELKKLKDFTLMLDESQYIKNEKSNRAKFILRLEPTNVILLSGTPVAGKYEELWSQCKLLGWGITKTLFWKQFIDTEMIDAGGFWIPVVKGYKNVDRLKEKLQEHGAVFMKTEEVINLPEQIDITVNIENTKEYRKFKKDRYIEIEGVELVGDITLTKLLYLRQLASTYNNNKIEALKDILESTSDRLIIFYFFTEEFNKIVELCKELNRSISFINSKGHDLKAYDFNTSSITLVQYQAGASGVNLQKANKIIYYTLPLSSDHYQQSRKRVHRLGQTQSCMYYHLITTGTIEIEIYKTLQQRIDFTNELFRRLGE